MKPHDIKPRNAFNPPNRGACNWSQKAIGSQILSANLEWVRWALETPKLRAIEPYQPQLSP